jgi:integrase
LENYLIKSVCTAETLPGACATADVFSVEDFEKLITAITDDWFKRIVIFGVLTGLRRSEITNLQLSDINFAQKTLIVHSKADFKTKSGRRRIIAVSDTAMQILNTVRSCVNCQAEYIFTYKDKKIKPNLLTKKLKKAVKYSKLKDQRLHFHSLRHTFASWLAQKGTSIYEIQKLLGHSDIKTTQIYAHLLPNELHNTIGKLEGMVPSYTNLR